MKKFKKLLSVLLAVVMALSCFSIAGSAYQAYENPDAYYYDSNDNPRAYLYTVEQRATILVDMVNDLLGGAGIYTDIAVIGEVDLRNMDAVIDTIRRLKGVISLANTLNVDLGILGELNLDTISDVSINDTNGAQSILSELLEFLYDNMDELAAEVLDTGKLSLGVIGSAVGDLSAVEKIIGDLPSLLGGLIYGIGDRMITNGIGNDPEWPNSPKWDDLTIDERNANYDFDTLVQNLLYKLLTEPNNTMPTNDSTRNEIITNPEKFGATSDMIHQDENGYYYIYGTKNAAGEWKFTETSTVTNKDGTEGDRHDICQWKDDSALVKGAAAEELKEIINLQSGLTLYQMLEKAIPWAYDTFAGHNLDGQLRATLMQFCGAFNNGNVDDATKATLKAKVEEYKAMEDDAEGDKAVLRDEFAAKQGVAGNYNFMYIDLEGKKIGDKTSDSLYYVVEWGNSWQYYHVELGENGANVNALFDLIDWEYQAPMWDTIANAAGIEAGKSFLLHINDIVGTILKTAMPSLKWTAGTANNALRDNLVALMKVVIKNAKAEIWGENYKLPADFDNYTLEQALVLIAGELLDALMPQLVIPSTVTSIEEVLVYAVREFTAEVVPHLGAGWDAKIAEAVKLSGSAKEDAFLDIALNMGTSIGAYYLQNLIGYGTKTDGKNGTSVGSFKIGADYTWKEILDDIIDWVIATWLPNLKTNISSKFTTAMTPNNDEPLLKLSAVFSTLFPSVARILGADVDGYALNLEHVYADLRLALNGDFSALANGLSRQSGGKSAAEMDIMEALATLLVELFGGLGMEKASEWNSLKNLMNNAAAADKTLTTLIGKYGVRTNISDLAEYFVKCLTSPNVRGIWLNDALTFIAMLMGYESTLNNAGVKVDGVQAAYTGAESFKLEYSFTMTTSGVRTYFNNGRYKSSEGAIEGLKSGKDGDFSMTFVDARVVDANGNQKGYTDYNDAFVAANVRADGAVTFSGVTDKVETWTLETNYFINYPDGSQSEKITDKRQFTVSKKFNDSLSYQSVEVSANADDWGWVSTKEADKTVGGCGSSKENGYQTNLDPNFKVSWKNIYINEAEQLTKAASPVFTITDRTKEYVDRKDANAVPPTDPRHSYSNFSVNQFGSYQKNDDGTITVLKDDGTTQQDLTAYTPMTYNGSTMSNAQLQDLWFKWDNATHVVNVTPMWDTAHNTTSPDQALWVVEDSAMRTDYTGDFYSYGSSIKLDVTANCNNTTGANMDSSKEDILTITPYVTVYNSYGLEGKLQSALAVESKFYDTASEEWADFQAAIAEAQDQLYGEWIASSFVNSHKTTADYPYTDEDGKAATLAKGSSTFQLAGIKLDETMAALKNCELENVEDSGEGEEEEFDERKVSPDDPRHPLNKAGIYDELMAMDAKGYKSHNYVLYRWFKFSDLREGIRYVINAATRPEDAKNTLAGDPYDDEVIAGIISQIGDADVKAIVESLKEAPTEEAKKAAQEAIDAWLELPLNYDIDTLNTQIGDMKTTEKRLLPKYNAQQKYFLNDALTKYGNEAAANYTAESYAKYVEARARATEANNSSTSSQYEIFDSRYHFLVAYNNLVLTKEAVDMTALEASMAEAQAILDAIKTDGEYTLAADATVKTLEEAYKVLVKALGIKVTYDGTEYFVGGNFSGVYAHEQKGMITAAEQQAWVNSVTTNLDAAIDNFKGAAAAEPNTIMLKEDAPYEAVIDLDNNCDGEFTGTIYGIDTLGWDDAMESDGALADFLTTAYGDDYLDIIEADGGETTGTIINVLDEEGNVVESYVFIYFGDIDMNGLVDGDDDFMASYYGLNYEGIDTLYQMMAADLDGDGWPTGDDGFTMGYYGLNYEGMPEQAEIAEMVQGNYYEMV